MSKANLELVQEREGGIDYSRLLEFMDTGLIT